MIVLDLPQATPSRNAVDKLHWSKRHGLRGQWQWLVRAAVLNANIKVTCMDHGELTIERISPRKLDHDNFVGGCKQLQDALVHEGFFKDDSVKHLRTSYIQTVGKSPRTIVRINTP